MLMSCNVNTELCSSIKYKLPNIIGFRLNFDSNESNGGLKIEIINARNQITGATEPHVVEGLPRVNRNHHLKD